MEAAFVRRQGSSILADHPARLRLLILPGHSRVTALLFGVVSFFVSPEGLGILVELPTLAQLAIFIDFYQVTDYLPGGPGFI